MSNFAASRSRLLFRAPHNPLSVLTTTTARFFSGRRSVNGCMKSPALVVTSASTSFIKVAYGRPASAANWALRIFDAATICIALVICEVFRMDRMRRRKSRVVAMVNLRLEPGNDALAL